MTRIRNSQDFLALVGFSAQERLILVRLDELTPRGYSEAWFSAERLANEVGCSLRTVYRTIQHAIEAGILARVTDFALRTRRKLVLLYRNATKTPAVPARVEPVQTCSPFPSELTNPDGGDGGPLSQEAQHAPVRPTVVPRWTPPGREATQPEPSPRAPEPERPKRDEPQHSPEADAVAEVVEKAEAIFIGPMGDRVRAAARRYSLEWVRMALEDAERNHARSWRWVEMALERWRREGGPPPRAKGILERLSESLDIMFAKWDAQKGAKP